MTQTQPEPPVTGDPVVDETLADFATRAAAAPAAGTPAADLAAQVEAATRAHRALQQRLTNPEPTLQEAPDPDSGD